MPTGWRCGITFWRTVCRSRLYSDRHGIHVNAKDAESGDGLTVFNRMTQRLGIAQVCATTPQAKGRVERANKTLQDRLIKEMRLAGISDVAAAQAFLAGFMERHTRVRLASHCDDYRFCAAYGKFSEGLAYTIQVRSR